ncbi:MAG TPA: formate dehydrogenase subunit alpha [Rectinemataceae bacterium]|nr:formate dehydrogenase subunit alpha [Rectinemataceae bacterium]
METRHTLTTCPYCGCGCGLYLVSEGNRVTGALPSAGHPVSKGALCVKGWNSYEFVNHPARLRKPLIAKDGGLVETDWDEALEKVARSLSSIAARHGPDSVAFLSSAKMTNEENFMMMKLARAVFRTNNIDHCARLCHASTVAGLADTFGSGAMTNSIGDFDDADAFLVIGSDTTAQHPLIGSRIIKSVLDRGAKLLVFDPRKIELVKYATLSAQQRNGSDVALVNGLMHVIIAEGLHDADYVAARTEGFEGLRDLVAAYTPERVEALTSVPARTIVESARLYAGARKAMLVYAMGITQHVSGVAGVQALANLAMLTGHVGSPAMGVNPLRGQNNVQGACDMGALPDVFSGYQKVGDVKVREKFAKAWGVDWLPDKPGLTATEIMSGAASGRIKGLYIVGENPAVSDPDTNHVRKALASVEFLAVQDIFLTETARFAKVLLPASSYAEKDGTFTNTERRCQRVRKAVECPGEAREDWRIIGELASRCGYNGMNYDDPSEILDEAASLTPIYGGMSFDRLEGWGLQWPCPDRDHPGTPYLHKERFSKGMGTFVPREYQAPAEEPDEAYPFILSTGRVYWHWHTRSMTGRTSTLERENPECYAELNPVDAKALGVRNGERVTVASRRGSLTVRAEVTDRTKTGTVFIPFHFGEAAANLLTIAALDPVAKIPEFKVCAVKIEKAVG